MEGFNLGKIVIENSVEEKMKSDPYFRSFVKLSLGRYANKDWGNSSKEDKASNNDSVENGGLIFAQYKYGNKQGLVSTLYIVTDDNRISTVLTFGDNK